MTSGEIKALLLNRYAPPVWAFFIEVADRTGMASTYADGVAYNLYPSTGHAIEGFEIKVSRGDFLNEMKNPGKCQEVMQYCDKWWLVAPKGVAAKEELPKTWGFYEIVNNKFFVRKQAPQLDPIDPSLSFVAAMLRRATEASVPRSTFHEQLSKAREEARGDFNGRIDEAQQSLKDYKQKVSDWEEASGLKVFGDYMHSSKELGGAVRWLLKGGMKQKLTYETESAMSSLRDIMRLMEDFKKMNNDFPEIKI